VTPEDALKKDIIQLLCVEPMGHSTLSRNLAEDVNRETGLEKVIESVATFKKPESGKGFYELKEDLYDDYNVFFYHYSKEEQSKSEESQRNRRKAAGLPQCYPPPPLPPFTSQFYNIIDLMNNDLFLSILVLVLQRTDNLKTRCFSEGQVHRVLHLIGMCLNEEDDLSSPHRPQFREKAQKFHILEQLEQLVGNQRIDSDKELLTWTLAKWKKSDVKMTEAKSYGEGSGKKPKVDDALAEKRKAAAARKAKLMAQMQSQQKSFIKENAQLFAETASVGGGKIRSEAELEAQSGHEEAFTTTVALGPARVLPPEPENVFTCILCQDDQTLASHDRALVMAAYVQRSTVLCKRRQPETEVGANSDKQEWDLELRSLHNTKTVPYCWLTSHALLTLPVVVTLCILVSYLTY